MPPPPPQVAQWLKQTYPHPTVDAEWLEGCYTWIQEELQPNPARDMPTILENVNTQLLGSDFADSMVAGTGFPQDVLGANHAVLKGPVLVEVTEIMEIGHSAYSLLQIHESRAEYRKQMALRGANGDEQERKPMPKYPRSMLQFQLSDGASILPAVEFKPLPQFELGETPLGYKMVIRNVTIRRGTAFLEPRCVEPKGHQTADRDERREAIFLRGLKLRLGEEVPDEEPAAVEPQPEPAQPPLPQPPPPAPASAAAAPAPSAARATSPQPQRNLTPPHRSPTPASRSPLREISPPPEPTAGPSNAAPLNALEHADDVAEPRRRKRPNRTGRSPSPDPPPREEVLHHSRFFGLGPTSRSKEKDKEKKKESANGDAEATVTLTGPGSRDAMKEFARTIGLSPPRPTAIEIPDSDGDDDDAIGPAPSAITPPLEIARARARARAKQKEKDDGRDKGKDGAKEPVFGEPSSDDYGFDFEMDDSFLESVTRAEEEGFRRAVDKEVPKPKANGKGAATLNQPQTQTQTQTRAGTQTQTYVKPEVHSQVTSSTLFSLGGATTTVMATSTTVCDHTTSRKATPTGTSRPGSRAPSVPHPSSSQSNPSSKRNTLAAARSIINISDEEETEVDKENVPVPTRHVRRRVVRPADTDVIELSD